MARQEINPGYTMVREMALEANAVEGASSCVGNGKCCTAKVAIGVNDMAIIARGTTGFRIWSTKLAG